MDFGIHTRPFFNPLSSQPAFKKVRDSKNFKNKTMFHIDSLKLELICLQVLN